VAGLEGGDERLDHLALRVGELAVGPGYAHERLHDGHVLFVHGGVVALCRPAVNGDGSPSRTVPVPVPDPTVPAYFRATVTPARGCGPVAPVSGRYARYTPAIAIATRTTSIERARPTRLRLRGRRAGDIGDGARRDPNGAGVGAVG